MIRSLRRKRLQQFVEKGTKIGIQPDHADRLGRLLAQLDASRGPRDMNLPGWRLHQLSTGHWSVWVNCNWRMTLDFEGVDAILVDYRDCHQERSWHACTPLPHPGATLRENVLPALGLAVTSAATQLGVTRAALSQILNEHAAISRDMARRIEAWLGRNRGGDAKVRLRMQATFDLST